jgi:hypothetical protein
MAKIELLSHRWYKPDDLLAVRPLNWDEIFDDVDDVENWAKPRVLRGGRSHPGDGNDNDDEKGVEDTQGSDTGTGRRKGVKVGKRKWKGIEDGKEKGNAMEQR